MQAPQTSTRPSTSFSWASLYLVGPEFVDELWPDVEKLVARALRKALGRINAEDVRAKCRTDEWQLWVAGAPDRVAGVGVTQLLAYPQARVLSVLLYSGEREGVMHLWKGIELYAKGQECTQLQVVAHRGLLELGFRELGFRERVSLLVKEV